MNFACEPGWGNRQYIRVWPVGNFSLKYDSSFGKQIIHSFTQALLHFSSPFEKGGFYVIAFIKIPPNLPFTKGGANLQREWVT